MQEPNVREEFVDLTHLQEQSYGEAVRQTDATRRSLLDAGVPPGDVGQIMINLVIAVCGENIIVDGRLLLESLEKYDPRDMVATVNSRPIKVDIIF